VSHIVTVKTRLRDAAAIAAACQRLHLPAPVQGTAKLFSGEATGMLIQFPGWHYPALTDEERRFMKRVSDRYRNRN